MRSGNGLLSSVSPPERLKHLPVAFPSSVSKRGLCSRVSVLETLSSNSNDLQASQKRKQQGSAQRPSGPHTMLRLRGETPVRAPSCRQSWGGNAAHPSTLPVTQHRASCRPPAPDAARGGLGAPGRPALPRGGHIATGLSETNPRIGRAACSPGERQRRGRGPVHGRTAAHGPRPPPHSPGTRHLCAEHGTSRNRPRGSWCLGPCTDHPAPVGSSVDPSDPCVLASPPQGPRAPRGVSGVLTRRGGRRRKTMWETQSQAWTRGSLRASDVGPGAENCRLLSLPWPVVWGTPGRTRGVGSPSHYSFRTTDGPPPCQACRVFSDAVSPSLAARPSGRGAGGGRGPDSPRALGRRTWGRT